MRIKICLVTGASLFHACGLVLNSLLPMLRRFAVPLVLLLAVTATATAQAVRPPARATEAAQAAEQTVQLEAFTVTGSNIRRLDAETALPLTVIDAAELDARGASTMS